MCALPFQVQFLFESDLASVGCLPFQPKRQAVRRICARAGERLAEQVRGNNLFSVIIAVSEHQITKSGPLSRTQFKSAGGQRIAAKIFFEFETRQTER